MEKEITRTIKFMDKKIVMKPMEGKGLVETWMTTPPPPISDIKKEFIKIRGIIYYLNTSVDKSQTFSS
jgi:hypothetical protein